MHIQLDLLIYLQITSVQSPLVTVEHAVRAQKAEQLVVPYRCGEGFAMEFSLDKLS